MLGHAVDGVGLRRRVEQQKLVFKPLLDVKFEGPLGESVHLCDQLLAAILSRQPGVIGLNEVDLQGLLQHDDDVLRDPIHLNDQVHHVLCVFLVCFEFVKFLEVVLISFQREDFQDAVFTFIDNLVESHHLGSRLNLLMLVYLDLFNDRFLDSGVDLGFHDRLELCEVLFLLLYKLQISLDTIVVVFHHGFVCIVELALELEDAVLRGLLGDDLVVTAYDGQVVVEFSVEHVVISFKLVDTLAHESAQLVHLLLRR